MSQLSQKQTAKKAIHSLCSCNKGFCILSAQEKRNLSIVVTQEFGVPLYGNAFDVVRSANKIDYKNIEDIRRNLESITIYEVKSTNKANLPKDFKGYFFDLTTAELLVAQSLGKHFRFAFVNTVNGNYVETDVRGLLATASRIYPKWAITLGPLTLQDSSILQEKG